ncbi:MAG: DUF1036 domain-containing protein [Candidatus Phaeomarinobacter sp.]
MTERFVTLILSMVIGIFSLVVFTPTASASLDVCNESTRRVGIALGYYSQDVWVSEGWWHVDGGDCAPVINSDLSARYYYLFAIDFDAGGGWSGLSTLCVAPGEFTISGRQDCETRGHHTAGFMEIDTAGSPEWTVRLDEATRRSDPRATLGNLTQGAN